MYKGTEHGFSPLLPGWSQFVLSDIFTISEASA
jgi:hypothetical protein